MGNNGIATLQGVEVRYVAPFDAQAAFLDVMETRRAALIMELRDLEKHLMQAGRVSQPMLRPVKDR
jgi:hypothetical protein